MNVQTYLDEAEKEMMEVDRLREQNLLEKRKEVMELMARTPLKHVDKAGFMYTGYGFTSEEMQTMASVAMDIVSCMRREMIANDTDFEYLRDRINKAGEALYLLWSEIDCEADEEEER